MTDKPEGKVRIECPKCKGVGSYVLTHRGAGRETRECWKCRGFGQIDKTVNDKPEGKVLSRLEEIQNQWFDDWDNCPVELKAEHYLLQLQNNPRINRDYSSELIYLRQLSTKLKDAELANKVCDAALKDAEAEMEGMRGYKIALEIAQIHIHLLRDTGKEPRDLVAAVREYKASRDAIASITDGREMIKLMEASDNAKKVMFKCLAALDKKA